MLKMRKKIFGIFYGRNIKSSSEEEKVKLIKSLGNEKIIIKHHRNFIEELTRRTTPTELSDENQTGSMINDLTSSQSSLPFSLRVPLRAHFTQTGTSTGADPIRTGIEKIVDSRMAENMPVFQRIMESMINKRFENIGESGIHIVQPPVTTFALTKDQVKETILKAINVGDVFYPSDIANQFGLELETVVEVLEDLKREDKISEAPKQD